VEASYVFRKAGVLDVVHSYPCMILKIAGWIHSAIAPQINIFTQAKVNLSKMYMNHIIMFITLAYNELRATSEENSGQLNVILFYHIRLYPQSIYPIPLASITMLAFHLLIGCGSKRLCFLCIQHSCCQSPS